MALDCSVNQIIPKCYVYTEGNNKERLTLSYLGNGIHALLAQWVPRKAPGKEKQVQGQEQSDRAVWSRVVIVPFESAFSNVEQQGQGQGQGQGQEQEPDLREERILSTEGYLNRHIYVHARVRSTTPEGQDATPVFVYLNWEQPLVPEGKTIQQTTKQTLKSMIQECLDYYLDSCRAFDTLCRAQ